MNHIEQFWTDAHNGGYEYKGDSFGHAVFYEALLDKNAWIAVGKTRGWKTNGDSYKLKGYAKVHPDGSITPEMRPVWEGWEYAWHSFINHLTSGKDINTALGLIAK